MKVVYCDCKTLTEFEQLIFIASQAVDDEDGTVAITYRIKSGQSPNGAFLMNSRTGELTLQDFLNFEDTPVGPNGKFSGVYVVSISPNYYPFCPRG